MNQHFMVVGDPIGHSLSPAIHRAFAEQLGLTVDYRAHRVAAGTLTAFLRQQPEALVGLNVTTPLKGEAFALANDLGEAARHAGAVNTLMRRGGRWFGDTTDGRGLINDLEQHLHTPIQGRRVLLLGAGGAAAAVAPALSQRQPAQLLLANRTASKAQALAARCGPEARAIAWASLSDLAQVDVVLHALSSGLAGQTVNLPRSLLSGAQLVYDLSYGHAAGAFLRMARENGARRCSDGLGMLVEQAAASFALWHRCQPDTGPVLAALRAEYASQASAGEC